MKSFATRTALLPLLTIALLGACAHTPPPARTFNAERAFMERSLERDAASNPQLIFLLLGQYQATRQQRAGLEFFQRILKRGGLPDEVRAVYLAVSGALRAQTADEIPLLSRISWVEDAIAELDEAVRMTRGEMFIVRWLRAVVLAQLPDRFEKKRFALEELQWAESNIDQAPAPGLLRETLYLQATLHKRLGRPTEAKAYLKRSGYQDFNRPVALTTPFTLSKEKGFAFGAPQIREVIPGRLYSATGYDFMEYHFLVSANGRALISIDAGSRGDSMAAVLSDLRVQYPGLPPLTTVLVTHSHWDHIGGQKYLRTLDPKPEFWASSAWSHQLEHQERTGGPYEMWWGRRFDLDAVTSFRPDHEVTERQTIQVDGTDVELIPITGGETRDAMLIHLPADKTVFGGDFIMPYLGAPFVREGSATGLVSALDVIGSLAPERVLHGHDGINRIFPDVQTLLGIRAPLRWLQAEVLDRLSKGATRTEIQHANLTPVDLLAADPKLELPFLVIREHLINRVVDDKLGYWQSGYGGSDYLTPRELGSVLVHYVKLDTDDQADIVEDMIEAGDHELALRTLNQILPHAPKSKRLLALKKRVHLALVDKEQTLDAFKFIWYGGEVGFEAGPPR